MQPSLDRFEYLTPIIRQSVMFRNMPKVEGSIVVQSVKFRNIPEVKEGIVA